jgi:hypothetical protein
MKFFNFGKLKKAVKDLIKSISLKNKKQVTKTIVPPDFYGNRFKRRLGGCQRFGYKLVAIINGKKVVKYQDFRKKPLPDFKMFIGKHLYSVILNKNN